MIPAKSIYTITAPVFEEIKINLNPDFYGKEGLIIRKKGIKNPKEKPVQIIRDNEQFDDFFISHKELINSNELLFHTTE